MDEDGNVSPRILSLAEMELRREPDGCVTLRLDGGETQRNVQVRNPLPLEDRLRFVSFADSKGDEIAMVRIEEDCCPIARAIIKEELAKRYLYAVIRRILSVKAERHMSYWQVATDRGRCDFTVANVSENVRWLSPERLIITDACENRYDIVKVSDLDPRSRRILLDLL